ncbi:MAG TPA: hypothetical protein GX700_08325 [Paracoccus sp.]|nr:hypothetical protein [Paracoccus sp. (in: a-proteobacteria)]
MQKQPPPSPQSPVRDDTGKKPDIRADVVDGAPDAILDGARPLDNTGGPAIVPTDPPVVTALDDDEGGADAIDPDTGLPYDDTDAGTETPLAGRTGGTPEV